MGNQIADQSDAVGASPVGDAPTASSFLGQHLASMNWPKTTSRRDEKRVRLGIWCDLHLEVWQYLWMVAIKVGVENLMKYIAYWYEFQLLKGKGGHVDYV